MSGVDERRRQILTTHTGSLPRPDELSALIFAKVTKGSYDPAELARRTRATPWPPSSRPSAISASTS